MADGAPRPPLYRSVSFKLLERWSGGPGPREGAADTPGLRRRASCRPAAAVPGQPSRRVSKLASGPPAAPAQPRPLRSLSPSVRQLSRRFDAPRRDDDSAAARDGGVSPGAAEEAAEGAARGAWPSVTEMRKLFGGPGSRRPSADSDASGTPSPDGAVWEPPAREPRQPPTPPPRTCFPLAGLRSVRPLPGPGTEGRRRRQQQQQQQQERAQRPADGLHSWHSFSQPQAGARASCSSSSSSIASYPVSRSRAASSSEEEEEGPPPQPGAQSPAYHGGLSSGSEEDQDGEGGHRWGGRLGPRPGSFLVDKDCRPDSYGLNLGTMDLAGGARSPEPPISPRAPSEERPREWGTGSPPCVPGPQEGLRPLSDTVGGAYRVAKVSFPAYLTSPSGSRGSSRYSSTETLKDEDPWASRGSGGWGVYRSPSFGAGEGLLLRPQVRTRTKGPVGTTRALRDGGSELDKTGQRKSLSNPDIASETLTLLSFLRSDLSELRVRKPGGRPGDLGSGPLDGRDSPSAGGLVGQLGPVAPSAPAAPGTRPTLKDLTATLRRAKSFTYSEKPMARRLPRTSALKPSSSELLLAGPGAEEDPLPLVVQDQYVQEARQVFEKIQRMGAQQDDGSDVPTGSPDWAGDMTRRQRSQEELSGPESSLTDEGIGADPEPPVSAFCNLGTTGVWRPLNSSSAQTNQFPGNEDSLGGWSLVSPDNPPTPGALRRRRKIPPSGPGGTELSNGEAGEAYRSLSDPIPQRHRTATSEEPSGFSVDSNLLGSLSPKTGLPAAPTVDEGLTSGHSDCSVGSEESKGYQEVIQSIVQEPGALGRVVDDRVAGKAPKKKSLSDPSRRGELAGPGFEGPGGEPIREVEPMLPPSSSEPILAEQRAETEEPIPARGRAQSERALPEALPSSPSAEHDFHLDSKLADVLSPRLIRRGSKKRPARSSHQELQREEGNQDQTDSLSQARLSSKHVRHASVPATFTPIVVPEPPTSVGPPVAVPEPMGFPAQAHPKLQAPSLEDVTKQYMLTLHSGEVPMPVPVDMPCLTPVVVPPSTEAKPPETARAPDEPASASKCCSKPQVDMRKHVTMTLLDTEQSYVESLRTLMQGYMQPLKQPENSLLCDPSLVDEIFDQIPELLEHHEQFLEQVRHCVQTWHAQQKVGDLLIQSFSKDVLVNIYSAYIDNFLNAKDAVRVAKEARPAFLKFLEQSMRENKEKQALSDLMIKPVQRIPRYELLVKDLLKHTPEDHPDHPLLLDAQRNIKEVAERINKGVRSAEEAERHARVLQEIEAHIEGMEDLQAPMRRFLRQEMVIEVKAVGGKKDRSLFLFTDLLVCTTLKRKSGSLRRSSMSLYTAASVIDTASKYKLLWKLPLEDADIIKGASQVTNRESIQKAISRLDEDLTTLGQMNKLSESLGFPHQSLDDALRDLSAAMHRDLSEKQALCYALSFPPTKLELCTTRPEGTDSFIFEFPHPDARLGFEQAFDEAKRKLASSKSCLDPEFLKAIPIMKTRSGMQFSCAAPTLSSCPEPTPEVWVCNSDGYVGQVCLLSLRAEPDVEACIAVCSARILCIGAVPGLQPQSHRERPSSLRSPQESAPEPAGHELDVEATDEEAAPLAESGPQACLHISIASSGLEMAPGPTEGDPRPELVPFDSDSDDESSPSPSGTLQSQASRSTISSSFGNEETPSSKEATVETTSSEEEQEPGFLSLSGSFGPGGPCGTSPMDGRALRRSSRGSFTRGSLEDLLSVDPEAYQSSVWLGTEDGCVHVYQSSDSIRDRRNSMKLQHAASVTCILYLNNQVFVSLANGELVVYQREAGRFWDPQNFKSVTLGPQGSTITKMVSVGGRLWCGCQNRVLVLSPDTLQLEHTFYVGQDSSRSVACMVDSSLGVWVTLKGSAHVCLYHPDTFEQLAEVDVTPPVHRMLAGSDAIIRQHKAACLRITALLVCEELLWVGTSAGVVLTMPTSPSTVSCPRAPLSPTGLGQGHTGHVRFLAAVQLPDGFNLLCPTPPPPPDTGPEKLPSLEHQDSPRHRGPTSARPKMLVISGGDGYEDFRLSSGGGGSSETVGRDDSTNHLLLWRV
ncbi:rho guanine nucleotide exchange factor 17 isoform X1 [Rousettus aegyptiacus]|uniref:Rho guanine nucleotide exchange factor 17 n=2 Tax=Rousettus aegyptiacus TaxID=9407 RepID=A0A7J8GVK3_ROUAE|nr:rho guanine nucleotide exchange factor 17 isoform X1 [Rousettus aegyptiacus]KAF6463948.1 Rho guanine nucleotide exchange factor 17 [Rousettus aegyptiacus]